MELNVHNIYHLNHEKKFTEDEAYELVNLLHAITPKTRNKINSLNTQLENHKFDNTRSEEIQNELNTLIHKWSEKVRRLGGIPLALYKVRIPAEQGYYIWEFPKADIEFFS
ncbi:MAG: hypothetical protein CME62_17540 [Halobacteriovoraceae bacterium]|nr:hypothetical protein [Halobacteriovoraceae bacterium]|tara:strand:- start:33724 stop:34056 length:333 start_codon:yes stop_codon:yes gene_type:complete